MPYDLLLLLHRRRRRRRRRTRVHASINVARVIQSLKNGCSIIHTHNEDDEKPPADVTVVRCSPRFHVASITRT